VGVREVFEEGKGVLQLLKNIKDIFQSETVSPSPPQCVSFPLSLRKERKGSPKAKPKSNKKTKQKSRTAQQPGFSM